jgi:uncharacterized protein (TIGR02453 family)
MEQVIILPSTYHFLQDLAANNNREWFALHKEDYTIALENMINFVEALGRAMGQHDELEVVSGKKSLYRIYNDVRFSKDKTPYSAKFGFSFRRATKYKRGGYYMHLKPGNSFLACGFFAPNPEDLKRIRKDIEFNYPDWEKQLKQKPLVANFGSLQGRALTTAPRGFDPQHPGIHLLRRKQFILRHNFSDAEVFAADFLHKANQIFQSVRPFFNYMSAVLTTDGNGEVMV